jgi:hypothetical protein
MAQTTRVSAVRYPGGGFLQLPRATPILGTRLTLIAILIASFAFPDSASLSLFGLRLSAYRICLIVLFPLALGTFVRLRMRMMAADWFMVAFGVLQAVALMITHGPFATVVTENYFGTGTVSTNILINCVATALESLGPYFVARAFIRNTADAIATARLLILFTIIIGMTTFLEATTGWSVYGNPPGEIRLHLHRAAGPFPHPILWGVFAASTLSFSLMRGLVGHSLFHRLLITGIVSVAAFTSVSSAAIAALVVQLAVLSWLYFTVNVRHRGLYFFAGCVAAYTFIAVFSDRPVLRVIFDYAALDSFTGFYRTLQWQYGFADFLTSPWIGIGYNDWARPYWMTSSIDAFWLNIMQRYGLFGTVPLVLAFVAATWHVARKLPRFSIAGGLDISYAWLSSVTATLVAGVTVHFWGQSVVAIFLLLGMWQACTPRVMAVQAGASSQDAATRPLQSDIGRET